ncbi:MAG: lipopolysaccharide biosynthesis protein [Sphingomonadales bacterium]|nr:lipopolysaccharide biosynthesis protein [Sphingomonadales bacterium]
MNRMVDLEEPQGGNFITYLPAILWQRRWFIIIPLIIGIVAALVAVIVIPPTYRSSALMLVRSAQLSKSTIGADGNEDVNRRIAQINEQLTSRPDLVALIEKYSLYKDLRSSRPLSEVIEKMRDAIKLTPSTGENDGSGDRTIGFRLSFDYGEAAPAQAVAQDLMQRIVELDATGNSEQAARRVAFLTEEAKGLEQQITDLQGKISGITAQNGGILSNGGGMVFGGSGGSYDVQIAALQRDNANLNMQRDLARKSDNRDPAVAAAEAQLAAARAVYSEHHPDVIFAKQRLAEARELAKSNTGKLPFEAIDQQIAFNNSQLAALRAAKVQEQSAMIAARTAQSRGPLVQTQLAQLQQQLSDVNAKYQGVSTQLMAARAGVRAEDEQLGERLVVVDPPVIPDKPVWPDRLLLAALGIGGGLGIGLVLALGMELLLQPIRDPASLAALVGSAPLATIPLIQERPKPQQEEKRWSFIPWKWARSR